MAGKERRRIQTDFATIAGVDTIIGPQIVMEDNVNAHSLRASISITPVSIDANASGHWSLIVVEETGPTGFSPTIANINAETLTNQVWAIGTWNASNQSPFTINIAPKTSRNIPKNGRLILRCLHHIVSSGSVEYLLTLTCHVRQI